MKSSGLEPADRLTSASRLSQICLYSISDGVPRRSFVVALIVGAILNLINQGDALFVNGRLGIYAGMELHRTLKYLILITILLSAAPLFAQPTAHQGHGDHLGASVMPFDLARSSHIFTPTTDGGTQEVVSKDGDPRQIALIRDHLRKEAAAFARGDYTDPTSIHGTDMPGLNELKVRADRVHVAFEELPQGARLRFSTRDATLVAALHQWFEAQVRDHGDDAVMQRQ